MALVEASLIRNSVEAVLAASVLGKTFRVVVVLALSIVFVL
jgi:hypothetical protein